MVRTESSDNDYNNCIDNINKSYFPFSLIFLVTSMTTGCVVIQL